MTANLPTSLATIGGDDLAGDQPIDQHADGGQLLIDRRLLKILTERFDDPRRLTCKSFNCNCPGWLDRSRQAEGFCQARWVLGQAVNDVPALLLGGREEGADDRKVRCALQRTEAAGDFLT